MTAQVIQLKNAQATKEMVDKIHTLAADGKVWWYVPHFKTRMVERDVVMKQVLEVMKKGKKSSSPRFNKELGEWQIRLRRYVGGRDVAVVVALGNDMITPVTVY